MWFLNFFKGAYKANSSRKWIMALLIMAGAVFRKDTPLGDDTTALIVFASAGGLYIIVQGVIDFWGVHRGIKHPDPKGKPGKPPKS
jgi:hypothetical protein